MKLSDLRNKPVVSLEGAETLGFLDDIYVDTKQHRVVGFKVRRGGLITHREAMLLADIESIGGDAVTVKDASKLNDPGRFTGLADDRTGDDVIGSRVLTEGGEEIGKVADLEIDLATGQVTEYLLGMGIIDRLRGREHPLTMDVVRSVGNKLVVVADSVTAPA